MGTSLFSFRFGDGYVHTACAHGRGSGRTDDVLQCLPPFLMKVPVSSENGPTVETLFNLSHSSEGLYENSITSEVRALWMCE